MASLTAEQLQTLRKAAEILGLPQNSLADVLTERVRDRACTAVSTGLRQAESNTHGAHQTANPVFSSHPESSLESSHEQPSSIGGPATLPFGPCSPNPGGRSPDQGMSSMMDLMTAANPVIQEEWAQRQYEGYPSIDDLLFGSITNPDWEVGAPGLDLLLASPQEVMVGGEIPIASSSWPQIEPKLSQQLSNMLPADDLPAIGSELIEFPAVQDDQEGLAREISASQSEHKSEKRPKKRRPFNTIEIRKETGLTRQMNACVRCRMQRIRCRPDRNNPRGECISCNSTTRSIFRLPCLRYKVSDMILYRTDLNAFTFYQNHPLVGANYGDFHIPKAWVGATTKLLDITQDRGAFCRLEVREFLPPVEEGALDIKGRPMYHIPWAIENPDAAVKAFNKYVDESLGGYLDEILDDTDHLVWDVFHSAMRLSVFPSPIPLLQGVLRLWVVCRFIEGRWRCCGDETLKADELKNPFRSPDWISVPPYIDYQMASIIIHRILGPLRQSTLARLQTMILANKTSNWYIIFLATFILLHNYELGVSFQRQFSSKRNAPVRYIDMSVIRASHAGAKTILAHFHYCCKGQHPFKPEFDWKSSESRGMAGLDEEQMTFLERYTKQIRSQAPLLQTVNRSDQYEAKYWFVSQLFESEWSPRDTYEHSPPA